MPKRSKSPDTPQQRICAVVARIPLGKVATYGQVAALAGLPGRARLTGRTMAELPPGSTVPWQRVVNARGEVSPRGGLGIEEGYQRHLLEEEGVVFDERGRIDLDRYGWDPDAAPPRPKRRRKVDEVALIRELLLPLARPERVEGEKRYLKSDLEFLGVSVPDLRTAIRAWLGTHPELDRPALLRLVEALWETSVHEMRVFGIELLRARVSLLESSDIGLLETLLRRSGSWAYVDSIAVHLVGPLADRDPGLFEQLDSWLTDRDFWLRRSAVLALLLPLRRGGGDWPRFVRYADALLHEKEFFIRKALGWVLREVAKKHPERVRRFLEEREGRVSSVTRREAERYL